MDFSSNTSILMFPWLGHGHISPFLELAKRLAKRNFTIHLCTTPAHLDSVKQKLEEKFSLSIQLVELHLPITDLPPAFHTTNGLPSHLMPTLKKALDLASPQFTKILKTVKPYLLIYDLLQPWVPVAASTLNIPAAVFIATSATMASSMFYHYRQIDLKFPFPVIYYRSYERAHLTELLESSTNQKKDKDKVSECVERSSNIVLIKSVWGIEGKYGDCLSVLTRKKIVPVGALVQDPGNENMDSDHSIEWLDGKGKGTAVFVSFVSEYFLSDADLEEVAHGLELNKINFIWVVRFPKVCNGEKKVKIEDKLPIGFLETLRGRGKVVKGWAPQERILGQSSIGGFVSHCGWSSVMESMTFGVPIIAMPMHLDQPINARLVAEVGAGVEVVRDINGKLNREMVAAVVKHVVLNKEGEAVREKAREISESIRNNGDEEIDRVVEELVHLHGSSKKANLFTSILNKHLWRRLTP